MACPQRRQAESSREHDCYLNLNRSCSCRCSLSCWYFTYLRIISASRPTVSTQYPRAQKCCPKDKRSNGYFPRTDEAVEPHQHTETDQIRLEPGGRLFSRPLDDRLGDVAMLNAAIWAAFGARRGIPDPRLLGPGMRCGAGYQLTLWSKSYSGSGWTGSKSAGWSSISHSGGPRQGEIGGASLGSPM